MTRWSTFLACALLLASCRNSAANVVLASLDRSEKIDLLCAEIEQVTGNSYRLYRTLPLDLCDDDTTVEATAPNASAQFLGAVTQTESGTVAVVNFSNGAIFDTSVTVPGVTALRVGEQPTAIQLSPVDPRYTYVSSFSPKSVQAISTREVITGSPVALDDQGRPDPDEPALARQELRFDAGLSDLVLHEKAISTTTVDPETDEVTEVTTDVVYRYLYAAIPQLGQLVQIQVSVDNTTGEQTFESVTELQLETYSCSTVTPVPPPVSSDTDYHRICPEDFDDRGEGRFIKDVTTTLPCADGPGTGPMPVALAIDPGDPNNEVDDILLVADANQPVIHRFGVWQNGATPLEPVVSLTPTNTVVSTPYVPASSNQDDRAATQRYLYAVSANDSSVLAIDYTDSSDTFGAVLPVVAGISSRANEENVESRNRVRSAFSNARSLEVVTPFYELERTAGGGLQVAQGDPETDICDPNDPDAFALAQNERNMRGVFLAISLSNGSIFFLDVYDLNAPCRGGEGNTSCTLAETSQDRFASIRRHRRRFDFTPTTYIAIDGSPSLQFNATPGVLDPLTGEAQNSGGPGLSLIDCPSSHFGVFGASAPGSGAGTAPDGLICASSQAWSSFSQRWNAEWQALIPSSEGGLGLFSDESFQGEPGSWFLAGDVPFCQVGVIGKQDGTPSGSGLSVDELQAYVGDRLVITGELPTSTQDDEACVQRFTDLLEDIDDFQVWFPIVNAFEDQLEIGPSPDPGRYTLDEVRRCFNQFTAYQIHTQDVYTVTGTSSAFIHRIVPDPAKDGLCVFDQSRPVDLPTDADDTFDVDTYLTARAFGGTEFINPLVSFEITDFPPNVTPTDSTIALLTFSILNQFSVQTLDTGGSGQSLPASMLFSPDQEQVYFVDFEAGVQRIVFSPLSIVQTFE
ncbi:MAG: hypothetical protein WBM48_12755 [Polyangiales bacterium]